jgi:murein L,D-transpeptidase YcbB/YkuD
VILAEGWPLNNAQVRIFSVFAAQLLLGLWIASTPVRAQDATGEALNARVEALQAGLEVEIGSARLVAGELLSEIYARRSFQPLWPGEARIRELLALLENAALHGLDPDDYQVAELRSALLRQSLNPTSFGQADLDLLASEALIRYVYHLRFGKVNASSLDTNINFRREFQPDLDPPAALAALTTSTENLAAQLAEALDFGPIYLQLQAELARYRQLAAAGGWEGIAPGPTLKPGDQDLRVSALRVRLAVTGELDSAAAGTDYDKELETAVRRFQQRHALDEDGVAGAQTLAAASVPVEQRIDQLRLSLERLRWVQKEQADRNVLVVNIAGFRAFLMENGLPVWSARVQVGTPYRQTPLFRDDIRYLEINPTWTVPPTILRKDILPKLRDDPGYLTRREIDVIDKNGQRVDPLSLDWSQYSRGVPYTLRQRPGPNNALGRVKFMFPNEHFVFLHDTPSRSLFGRARRAFSSGCIRVERPFELAELLLRDSQRWNEENFDELLAGGKTTRINLPEPVPILILYLTASLSDDNVARFGPDVYERDPTLLAALDGPVSIELPDY